MLCHHTGSEASLIRLNSSKATTKYLGMLMTPPHVSLEDIYLFGGQSVSKDGSLTSSNELHKLSIGE